MNKKSKFTADDMEQAKKQMELELGKTFRETEEGNLISWIFLINIILFFWAASNSKLIPMVGSLIFMIILIWGMNK